MNKPWYEDHKFVKALNDWVGPKPTQTSARNIDLSQIPKMFREYNSYLYRSMVVDKDIINSLSNGKFKFSGYTSWSKSIDVAKKFTTNEFKLSTTKGTMNVLLKKKLPSSSIAMDIESFSNILGKSAMEKMGLDDLVVDSIIKEQEVLVKPNLKIDNEDWELF